MKKKKEQVHIHTYKGTFDARSHLPVKSAPSTRTCDMGCGLCHYHLSSSTLPVHIHVNLIVVGGEHVGCGLCHVDGVVVHMAVEQLVQTILRLCLVSFG
jgi:hypothetical protein